MRHGTTVVAPILRRGPPTFVEPDWECPPKRLSAGATASIRLAELCSLTHTLRMPDEKRRRPRRDRAASPSGPSATRGLTVQAAARVTGIPARSINFWTGPARVLRPDHEYRGRGSAKRFSPRNLVQLRVIHLLAQRGDPLASMRALMAQAEHSRSFGDDWFGLPALTKPARLRAEFLTCAHPGRWRRWDFRPEALGFLEKLAPAERKLRRRRAIRKAPPADSGIAYFGWVQGDEKQAREFVGELLDGDDIVVVNLARIKADLMTRLGP